MRRLPGLLLAAVAVFYLASAAQRVIGGDAAEFSTLYAEGGVAHPPGYPAYVGWLRLWSWLPARSPAHGAALATALLGILTALVLYRAARAWGASQGAAGCAVGMYAASPLAAALATHPEVFTPHALLCASIVRLAAPGERPSPSLRALLIGLAFGLGVSNQLTIVWLAPLGALALWRAAGMGARFRFRFRFRFALAVNPQRREDPQTPPEPEPEPEPDPRPSVPVFSVPRLGLALGGFALGLLPILYMVWTTAHPGERWVWGHSDTVTGLLLQLTRADYGSSVLVVRGGREPAAQLVALALSVGSGLLIVPALLALGVLGAALAGRVRALPRSAAWVWLITIVLAGPLFVALFNVPPRGLGLHVVERFHLTTELLLIVPLAIGLDAAAERIRARRWVRASVGASLVALALVRTVPQLAEQHRDEVDRYVRDTLSSLPPDAVVLATGDHRTFGFLYAQRALGLRRDVVCIEPRMLVHDWYRARVGRQLGRPLPAPRDRSVDTRALAQSLLDSGRPLFLADLFSSAIPSSFVTYPIGPLLRVLPAGAPPPSLDELEAMNLERVRELPFAAQAPPARDTWSALVRQDYARPFQQLAERAAAAGDVARVSRNRARALALAPWLAGP